MGVILTIIAAVGNWFTFVKMGHYGWEGIIPIYNVYVLFKEVGYSGFMMLWLFLPIANIIVTWCVLSRLARAFSKPAVFTLGLFLLSPVFTCILGFDDSHFNREFI